MALNPVAIAPTAKAFTATALVACIRAALFGLPAHRKGGNNQWYAIGDAWLRAFSVFSCRVRRSWTTSGACRKSTAATTRAPCSACIRSPALSRSAICSIPQRNP